MRIAVDTGGTFTDFVVLDGRDRSAFKIPSTPDDPARAILAGLDRLGIGSGAVVIHGTTIATNALLQRRLGKVTFITNEGLTDVLEIGRQTRTDLYALDITKTVPLVPAQRRIGVGERMDQNGRAVTSASKRDLGAMLATVRRQKPDAVAIGLLFSFLNDAGERRIERALKPLGIPVTRSADVAPEVREFERFSTTVANAALVPMVSRYLQRLEDRLRGNRLYVFQSNGGMARVRSVARAPVRLVMSGPAGGAVAAWRIGKSLGIDRAMTLDMGGTSTDVALLSGGPLRRGQVDFDGLPLLVPSLDIQSVGAGGGSVARVDSAGILRVGPESMGSDPGPACYGNPDGTQPTVTDAHFVLGRLPATLAGGTLALDADRAHRALESLARALGHGTRHAGRVRAAEGVLSVADATMARAARLCALERGIDPRTLPLFVFGGAGPLHAARLVGALPCAGAVVPTWPGNLSAHGMALADIERDIVRSILVRGPDRQRAKVDEHVARIVAAERKELMRDGLLVDGDSRRVRIHSTFDCRYVGQTYTLEISPGRSIESLFHRAHERRYGHAFHQLDVEVVNVRVRLIIARGARPATASGTTATKLRALRAPKRAIIEEREVWFDQRKCRVPAYQRSALSPGHTIRGPAIIDEDGSTTVIEPRCRARVGPHGHLELRMLDL